MKYWRGYLTAGILLLITLGLSQLAQRFTTLIDMFYPYVTRFLQSFLCAWTGGVDFTVWQVLAVLLVLAVVATLVLTIVLKWNFFQWLGWVLACASLLWMLHTGIYGLNYYAGPLHEDVRMELLELSSEDVEKATIYFRDQANALAQTLPRDKHGDLEYPSFEELAAQAGSGFVKLSGDTSPVFAGSTAPVKKLSWSKLYSAMGICGVTMPLTGEAAVNPDIPVMSLPFTMCHEMAHRMCIALEDDANFAAFLACLDNDSPFFQYSAYYMAYRYCYNAMVSSGSPQDAAAAARIADGIHPYFAYDLRVYNKFFEDNRSQLATNLASSANDAYIKVSGDAAGTASYDNVATLLFNWHVQELVLPFEESTEDSFDPFDKDDVDVSDLIPGGTEGGK